MSDIRRGDRVTHRRRSTMIGEVGSVKGNWAQVYWDLVDVRARKHHAAGNVNWVPTDQLKRLNRR